MEMERTTTSERNGALGRRFFAEQDRLKGGPAPELCAARYTAHIGSNPEMDRDGHEGFARAFYQAFDGIHHEVERVVADEHQVMVRFVLSGRHTGAFFGIPATGRPIRVAGHVLLRVEEGKVSELWGLFDEAGLLRQLGVLPS